MENIKELQGGDFNLETSLLEYGLLIGKNDYCYEWDEWFAIYKNGAGFGISYIRESSILALMNGSESWFVPNDVLDFCGQTLEEFTDIPFIHQLSSVIDYYGVDNILGSRYVEYNIFELNSMLGTDFDMEDLED